MPQDISRRSLLTTSAAALALPRKAFPAVVDDPSGVKLGVATYSLRKFSREQAIAMLKLCTDDWSALTVNALYEGDFYDDWDTVLGVNLKGAFLCSLRAAHVMARKRSGNIIHMSSGGATRAHRGNVAYDASKGGIEALTRADPIGLRARKHRATARHIGLLDRFCIIDNAARRKVWPGDES